MAPLKKIWYDSNTTQKVWRKRWLFKKITILFSMQTELKNIERGLVPGELHMHWNQQFWIKTCEIS